MRKSILSLIILFAVSFAVDTVTFTRAANVRVGTIDVDGHKILIPQKSKLIDKVIPKGETRKVLAVYADWYEIKIISGSDHAGKTGCMWSHRINEDKGEIVIEGCTLRSTPDKPRDNTPADTSDDPNFKAKVRKGAKVEILRKFVTWILVDEGWVGSPSTDYK